MCIRDRSDEVPVPITVDMQIDQGKYFSVQVNDVLSYQADMDLMNMFTEDAAKQLKIAIENDVFFQYFVTEGAAAANKGTTAGAKSGAYNLGSDTAPINQATPKNVLNTILKMSAALDEQSVPEDGRWLIMSPQDRHLLMQTDIAQAYFTGDAASTIRTGKVGMLDRFTVYVSNNLPSSGSVTSGLYGHPKAVAYASQMTNTETVRLESSFGDGVRGLAVYGYKVVLPTAIGEFKLKFA